MSKKLISIIIIAILILASAGAAVLFFFKKEEEPPLSPFMEMIGIGGGGAFFTPMIDPTNENNYFVTSDMGGLYCSYNKGETWSRVYRRAVFNTAYMAENGNIFVGGNGLYASYDSGKTLSLIYPKDVKYTVSRQGWNENLMLAPDYNNGYLKAVTTDGTNVYFLTIDWQGELRVYMSDYYGNNCIRLYTEQTEYTNPMSDVDVDIIKNGEYVYYSTQQRICKIHIETKMQEEVYYSQGGIRDFKFIDDYFFIVEDGANESKILYTDDFIVLADLLQYNTLPITFTKWGQEYSFTWRFKEITGNHFNSLYLSFSSPVNEKDDTVDGIMKFDGAGFEWVFDSMYKNRNTLSKADWSYGSHGPFYGIYANPHDDNMCLISNIESVYVAYYKNESERQVYTCHTKITEKEGKESFSTTGLNVQTTYFVYEDPFNANHIIICTTDLGLQNSYDGGKTFNRMEITGNDWSIYNTCYDLYFDTEVKDKVYGLWSSRHDAPYSPSIYDTNCVGGLALSLDGGNTWDFSYSSGLPSDCIPVKMSVVKKENHLQIAVATFNKGFFISNDSGKTFISLNNNITPYKGFIWGEDIVINNNIVYCLTASYYNTEGELCSSEFYEIDLTTNQTTKVDLGVIKIARSLTFNKDKGLFINVIPTFHYEWMEEYNDGLWKNDNGGIYHYLNGEITKYFENGDGIFNSSFSPDGILYAVDTYGKVFTITDSGSEIFADDLFTMLKNVSFSSDGKIVYITTFGGGTYKFNLEAEK